MNTSTITVAEAAVILEVSEVRVRFLIRAGRLPAQHYGPASARGGYSLRRADVDHFKATRSRKAGRPRAK